MTAAAPTISQIKAQVAAIRRKVPEAKAVGIHAVGRWAGQREYKDGGETLLIEQCDSPLAIRIALRKPAPSGTTIVVVTSLDDRDLDDDIRLRFAKRRLHPIDNWQIVKSLFQAHAIDPRVSRHTWIAEELLRLMPAEGYAPAAGGFLDADRVWSVLLRDNFGLTSGRPDLVDLLRWSVSPEASKRWSGANTVLKDASSQWLIQSAGHVAPFILRVVDAHSPGDAVAVGLALGTLYAEVLSGKVERATGKLEERFFGNVVPEAPVRTRWHAAATEVLRLHLADRRLRKAVIERADQILRDIGALEYAHLCDLSPAGFDQRLRDFAGELVGCLNADPSSNLNRITQARASVVRHDLAQVEPRRLDRVEMALRLLRWRSQSAELSPRWTSLAEAARYHELTGSFLDWARLALRAGDPIRELSEAYGTLLAMVTDFRDKHALAFGKLVRDWTAADSSPTDVIPVEDILSKFVAPIAARSSLLIVVLDGMSFAVWRELQADLAESDWTVIIPESCATCTLGLATIPSVTEASRTSLLCGEHRTGHATDERAGFEAHPALLEVCRSGASPRLFHKAALAQSDDAVLASDVRDAIGATDSRIVGVVVNAIDDHLFKGEQIDVHWTREQIKVLPALLHEARDAGRLVVLLSDHGHVLDHGSVGTRVEGGGERWRPEGGQSREGEITISGRRVLMAEKGPVIALAIERARYGSKRNGYHGGVTPQEMIVPIAVLSGGKVPPGWTDAPVETPEWWYAGPASAPVAEPSSLSESQATPELLFPEMRAPVDTAVSAAPAWISELLACSLFGEQKALAGRTVPSDKLFTKVLWALDDRGGRMTTSALARSLGRSTQRMSGLLAVVQRVLNLDGYAVLTRDDTSDTVELNVPLAKQQFGLKK